MHAQHAPKPSTWPLMIAGAAILMITMGARQTTGLFISPINTATGLGIVSISFALAIGQFVWGAAQPIFGAVADKYGASRVIVFGAFLLAGGMALTPFMHSQVGLIVAMGLLTAAGAGAGSFSILIGATAQRLPADKRSFAAGFINAGGSFGQFVFAPLTQFLIGTAGWVAAIWSMAAITLATIPLAWPLRQRGDLLPKGVRAADATPAAVVDDIGLKRQLRVALRNPSYLYLHAGFFTCGFHIAFLVTHLPGEVALCSLAPQVAANSLALIGLFNIAGSLTIGWLGQRFRMKYLLALMYAQSRVADRALSRGAEDVAHVLHLRGQPRLHVAGHRPADRRPRRQAVRHPLPGHAVRADAVVAPDRWLPRCVPGRPGAGARRQLPVDVVRRHRARRGRRADQPADPGEEAAARRRARASLTRA